MNQKQKRILMAFFGVILTGISVALFKASDLGTDPFSCLNLGIGNRLHLSYSVVFTVGNALLLLGVFIIKKHYIGIATAFTIAFTGIIVDWCMVIFSQWFPNPDLFQRIGILLAAVVLMCFASSLYFTADLGVSAYDAWALILADHKVAQFRICRIGTDLVCTVLGGMMGAVIGAGTLVTALFMGPLIEFFSQMFSRPLLYGRSERRTSNTRSKGCFAKKF